MYFINTPKYLTRSFLCCIGNQNYVFTVQKLLCNSSQLLHYKIFTMKLTLNNRRIIIANRLLWKSMGDWTR